MVNRKQIIAAQIVFIIGFILFSYGGILAGLHRDWFSMVFFFYIVVFSVHTYIGFMLDLKIDNCFERLKNIITNKSESDCLGKQPIFHILGLSMAAFTAIMLSLSILARQRPLILCIILVALTIINYISMAVVFALRIKGYSKRIEKLFCQTIDDTGSKELSAE